MKRATFILALISILVFSTVFAQRGVRVKGRGQATPYINGSFRALVIGNDKYRDPEGLWKPLRTAVNDARAVAGVLKNQYGFGDVRLLLNATRRQMNKAINKISEDALENDSVLIYYAGHGFLRESTREGYWIPVDAEGRDDGTYYPNAIIKTKLAVLAERAQHVFLVSDSCFSGSLLREGNRGISIDQRNERYYRKVAAKKSVQILAAGGLEFVDDNYRRTGHSPFTYFFLEELKSNTGGLLDATELSTTIVRNVANNVQQAPEKGVLHGAGHAGGEFFFIKAKISTAPPVTANVPQGPSKSKFNLGALNAAAEREETSRKAWRAKLQEMKDAFSQVQGYEARKISPNLKAQGWRQFLSAFKENNPYTDEDEALRAKAQDKIKHWEGEKQRLAGLQLERNTTRRRDDRWMQPGWIPDTSNLGNVSWKVQSAFGSKLPIIGTSGFKFSRRLKELSKGAINLKFYEPGALAKPLEILQNLGREDSYEAGYSSSGYNTGKNTSFAIFSGIPFGMDGALFRKWITSGSGRSLYEELYSRYGVYPVPCVMGGPEGFGWFKKEIHNPGDLRGLKMRFFGLGAKVMQKLGTATVLLAGSDIYPALKRGVIDATEFSRAHLDIKIGFYQIAKYYYYPGWHTTYLMYDLQVHQKAWNQLTPNARNIIKYACNENIDKSVQEDKKLEEKALIDIKGKGVDILRTPPPILEAARQAWKEVAQEESRKNKDFRRIYKAYRKYLKSQSN